MRVILALVAFLVPSFLVAGLDDGEFLVGSVCRAAEDCYINGGSELALACYYDQNKCKCYSTIHSIYHLTWDIESKRCLSSKYGHCGGNGSVVVGCTDGFACIENRCRDPNDTMKTVKEAVRFPVPDCNACQFSTNLRLDCDYWTGASTACLCKEQLLADGRSNAWDVRNYDGDNNCSVSQFGPCGTNNEITIGCHGKDMACVNDLCTNPQRPLSSAGEVCQEDKNCESGLICSHGYTCIKPNTSGEGVACYSERECVPGLACHRSQFAWGYRRCTNQSTVASAPPP